MSRPYSPERGYSPEPRRGPGGRGPPPDRDRSRSPPPYRRGPPPRKERVSLLVRNIPRDTRPEDLRVPFERYGPIKDVYLPKDYHTGEPRGFGFVQFVNMADAEDAQYELDRTNFNGREITVVFAEENRKKPDEMRTRERYSDRDRPSYGRRRGYSRSRSRSPPGRRSSYSPPPRRRSRSPPPRRSGPPRRSPSCSNDDRSYSRSPSPRGRARSPPRGPPSRGPAGSGGAGGVGRPARED
ncbi:hypothetical protein CLOM_g1895 [Closterium sp. NIES-68]|nr:hypothetical protein CLOM_g1895 [Closterium sp. NIES-68]GJP82522.1 hypothetical protein CLOP_g12769 [Closterium sp. NIES-67]